MGLFGSGRLNPILLAQYWEKGGHQVTQSLAHAKLAIQHGGQALLHRSATQERAFAYSASLFCSKANLICVGKLGKTGIERGFGSALIEVGPIARTRLDAHRMPAC